MIYYSVIFQSYSNLTHYHLGDLALNPSIPLRQLLGKEIPGVDSVLEDGDLMAGKEVGVEAGKAIL